MLKFKTVQFLGLGLLTATLLQGCGGASLGDNVKVLLSPETGKAHVEVTMSGGLEIALTGEFPVDRYGKIKFVPGTRTERAKIVFEFDLATLVAGQLGGFGALSALPNGAPLPIPMMGPLVKIPVTQRGAITVDAVLGIAPELQLGASIAIAQFRSGNFPSGVAISQTFRNKDGVAFAVISLYGPGVNGVPGGVFIGANFGEVLDIGGLTPSSAGELMAASSNRAMMASVSTSSRFNAESLEEVSENSGEWDETRHDPQGKLRNSRNAYNALQNAKIILKKR